MMSPTTLHALQRDTRLGLADGVRGSTAVEERLRDVEGPAARHSKKGLLYSDALAVDRTNRSDAGPGEGDAQIRNGELEFGALWPGAALSLLMNRWSKPSLR